MDDDLITFSLPVISVLGTYHKVRCLDDDLIIFFLHIHSISPLGTCHKVRCMDDRDEICTSIVLKSVKRLPLKFYKVLTKGKFVFKYQLDYSLRFYKVVFKFTTSGMRSH